MIKKLSLKDKNKAMDALTKCAAATSTMTDQDEVNKTVAQILCENDITNPELIKRACESYNSAKSIYKLANSDDDHRGDTFPLADSGSVLAYCGQRAADGFIAKAASANGVGRISFGRVRLNKEASAEPVAEADTTKAEIKMTSAEVRKAVKDNIEGMEGAVLTASTRKNNAEDRKRKAEKRLNKELDEASEKQRKEASEQLYAVYGETISPYLKTVAYNKNKYKGSVTLNHNGITKAASELLEADNLYKNACAIGEAVASLAVDTVKELFGYTMRKQAAGVGSSVIGSSISSVLLDALGFGKDERQKMREDILTTDAINALREHSARRTFMRIATDEAIAKHDLSDIVDAYNAALRTLPPNLRDRPSVEEEYLKSNVIARLTRGNVPSQADEDTIRQNQRAFGDITELTRGGFGSKDYANKGMSK